MRDPVIYHPPYSPDLAPAHYEAKTLHGTLATKVLAVASQQRTILHFAFHQEIFNQKQHDRSLPPTLLFSVSPIEDKTERPPFWHN
jgi:hypothetical protein